MNFRSKWMPSAVRLAFKIPAALASPLLLLCFGLSGLCGLIYEVLWMRELTDLFGSSNLATGVILAAYMGGMGLGALVVPARIKHHPGAGMRLYAWLEIATGAYALILPHLFARLADVAPSQAYWQIQLLRYGLALILLALPTFCMGATLPVLAGVLATSWHPAAVSGWLYGLNTLGGVVGTLLAGFWLIRHWGMAGSEGAAAGLNLLLGLGLLCVLSPTAAEPASHQPRPMPAVRASLAGLGPIGCTGAVAMLLEVAWTRLLSMVFGISTYAFSLILACFLLGLMLGSLTLQSCLPRLDPRRWMGLLLMLAGLSALLTLSGINALPWLFSKLFVTLHAARPAIDPSGLALGIKAWLAVGVMLPATFCFGALFPLACARQAQALPEEGARGVGRVYAWNTFGGVGGALLASWWLGPSLGFFHAIQLGAGLLLAVGLSVTLSSGAQTWRGAAVALAGLALLLMRFQGNYDPKPLFEQVFQSPEALAEPEAQRRLSQLELPFYRDGSISSVAVAGKQGNFNLVTDGNIDSSTHGELDLRSALADLPLLLAPQRNAVMVIGLGGGATAAKVLSHPVQELQVVEIEPMVVAAHKAFFARRFPILTDARTRLVLEDARIAVRQAKNLDVLISQGSHPWRSGSSGLYTQDFWRDASQALKPAGVFAQWLQLYALDPLAFKSLVASFQSVFPYVLMFRFQDNAILLGCREPLLINLPQVLARWSQGGFRQLSWFTPQMPETAADLLVHLDAGSTELANFAGDAPLNTRDLPLIEFAAPLSLLHDDFPRIKALLDATPPPWNTYFSFEGLTPAQRELFWNELRLAVHKAQLEDRPGLPATVSAF